MQPHDSYLTDEQIRRSFSTEEYVEGVVILLYGGHEIIDPDTHYNYTFSENDKDVMAKVRRKADQYWAWLNSDGSTNPMQEI